MCRFILLSYPHICPGEGKNLRKYILSFKLKQSFVFMIEEKTFNDLKNYMGSYAFVWWFLSIQNVHDKEMI